ncbi:MAG: amidohydrolase family protein [Pseudomonadota bacterium]
MRRYLIPFGLACVAFGCSTDQQIVPPAASADELVISNVVIVSPDRPDPSGQVDVLVRDGRIARIGRNVSRRAGRAAIKIDGAGRYLTPGLIDGHTHLSEIPGMTFQHEQAYPEVARAAHQQIPRSYLYHGFTTVIDLNARQDVVAEWNSRALRPQAYFCGAAPVVDGYPMSWMPKPARYSIMPYFLYDPAREEAFPDGFDPAEHSPAAIVAKMRADGAICVKTHFERGFGGRGDLPVPGVDLIRTLVSEARANEMPVLMHANSQSAQKFGVDAGVDAFAHGMWTWHDRDATEPGTEVIALLDAVIEHNIATQPTVQVLYGERDLHDPGYLSRSALRDVLPQSLLDWYSTEDGQWWRARMAKIPFIKEFIDEGRWQALDAEPIARVTATLNYLAQNKGVLLFGSDTPSDPTFANPPGLNGRQEIDNWIAAGVTPAALFYAATIGNAEFFGLQDEIGTVETGKRADLLLMRENPAESVTAYDTIDVVIVAGKAVQRSDLSALNAEEETE